MWKRGNRKGEKTQKRVKKYKETDRGEEESVIEKERVRKRGGKREEVINKDKRERERENKSQKMQEKTLS